MIERAPKGRNVSCGCDLSDAESSKPKLKLKTMKTTSKHTSVKATKKVDRDDKRLVSKDVLEKCGECNLHCRKYYRFGLGDSSIFNIMPNSRSIPTY